MSQDLKKLFSIDSVKEINIPYYSDLNGELIVIEGFNNIPFNIARVFTIIAPLGSIRGDHAHKVCTQFLTCPVGSIKVICDDGRFTKTYILDNPKIGLLLPPSIWAQQTYLSDKAVLNVLCDFQYDSQDYIRDYKVFKKYRK
jgi:dTDP-4-dehydrorhamnose 3,5-epimerase-like enzyme